MDWSAAVAGSALLSSICCALVLFTCLGFVFGYGWRTGAVAVLAVVAVNVLYPGASAQVMAKILTPFHELGTAPRPPQPEEKPSHWPNG